MEQNKYPFGTPKRVLEEEQKKANPPKPAEAWVPASVKGYERNTATGAIRQKSFMAHGACLESGELIPAAKLADDTATFGVVPSYEDLRKAWNRAVAAEKDGCLRAVDGVLGRNWRGAWADIPADRRADVIRALNALGA